MAPLTPTWAQPSHPSIQEVILFSNPQDFTTKSISKIDLPPYALYAKMSLPPCSKAEKPTYATVQMGTDEHLNLNSDLVYINHSCEPSVIFDMTTLSIIAGPRGLKKGDELTFFYPSTEWHMDQPFTCFCSTPSCRGFISGAKEMSPSQLEGMWLNAHIRSLLEEQSSFPSPSSSSTNLVLGNASQTTISTPNSTDVAELALRENLLLARKMVTAAQKALDTYKSLHEKEDAGAIDEKDGKVRENGVGGRELSGEMGGDTNVETKARRGVTSREMSGEMGGDTVA